MRFGRLIMLSAMLLSVNTACFAQVNCEVGNNEVSVNCNYGSDFAFMDVTMSMTGPFSEIVDKNNIEEAMEAVVNGSALTKTVFNEKKADSEGKITDYKFYPEDDNKFYIISVRADGEDEVYREVILNVSATLEGDVVDKLNDATDWSGIKTVFDTDEYYNVLVYKYDIFTKVKKEENKQNIYTALYNAKQQALFENLSGAYADTITKMSAISAISESTDEALAKEYAEKYLDLTFEENNPADIFFKTYSGFEEAVRKNVLKRVIGTPMANEDEWEDTFEESVFLQMIQNEQYASNLYTLINKYAEKFGMDMTKYASNQTNVNNALYNKYFKNISELNEAINGTPTTTPPPQYYPGGGGGGGSSSGSSSNKGNSVSISPSGTVIDNTQKPTVFNDLNSVPWAKDAVEALYKKNVVSGDGEGKFYPQRTVTREEFLKMLVSAMGMLDSAATHTFEDSKSGAWHYVYIASGVKKGITTGISETEFGVGKPVTRQDMAVMVMRAAEISATEEYEPFADDAQISDYAKEAVYALRKRAIINGKENNLFAPFDNATRAEAAKVIYGLISE